MGGTLPCHNSVMLIVGSGSHEPLTHVPTRRCCVLFCGAHPLTCATPPTSLDTNDLPPVAATPIVMTGARAALPGAAAAAAIWNGELQPLPSALAAPEPLRPLMPEPGPTNPLIGSSGGPSLYPQPLGIGAPGAGLQGYGAYTYRDTYPHLYGYLRYPYRYPLPLGWAGGGGGGSGVVHAGYYQRDQTQRALVEGPVEGAGGRRTDARTEEKTVVGGDEGGRQGETIHAGPVWSQTSRVRAAAARGRGRLASSKLSQGIEPGAEQGRGVHGLSHAAAAAAIARGGVSRRGTGKLGGTPGGSLVPAAAAHSQESAVLRNGKGSA